MSEQKRLKRFWIPDFVADHQLSALQGNDVKVLVVMSRHANKQGDSWPSVKTVGEKAGLNRRTVQRSQRRLCAAGLMVRRTGNKGGRTHSVVYRMFAQTWLSLNSVAGTALNEEETASQGPPLTDEKGVMCDKKGRHTRQERAVPVTPEGIQEGILEVRVGIVENLKGLAAGIFNRTAKDIPDTRAEAERQKAALRKKQTEGMFD